VQVLVRSNFAERKNRVAGNGLAVGGVRVFDLNVHLETLNFNQLDLS